jgi:hypothetical protein
MSILLNGSLDLTLILEKAKEKHSAFSKSEKNGHLYFNITQWVNDEPNDFGQHSSLLLNSKSKETQESEGKVYIGNAKKAESGGGAVQLTDAVVAELPAVDTLPF